MIKRVIIFSVIAGLLGITIGAWTVSKRNTYVPNATITVIMNEDDYVPGTITVQKGATIRFKNLTSVPRWPASNLHPSHLLYPEFDPTTPVMPNASWDFIAEKVGTWGYHDHLAPYITGDLIITD